MSFTVETDYTRLVFDTAARLSEWKDTRTGRALAAAGCETSFATVRMGDRTCAATSLQPRNDNAVVRFGETGVEAVIRVVTRPAYCVLEVVSVTGPGIDSLTFLDLESPPLPGTETDLRLWLQPLALNTEAPMHRAGARLIARCHRRFGLEGAKAALVVCPGQEMRDALKQVVSGESGLPCSPIGGPWALDAPCNRESYLFSRGMSEESVEDWIGLARRLGFRQFDLQGAVRFGDCEPNPATFPGGKPQLKAVIDRIHAAGMRAGMHTYSFFVAKDSNFVTPVPHPELAAFREFTLAADLDASSTDVPVEESTEGMSTIIGFCVENSVTLVIDDEEIIYEGVNKTPPFGFSPCRRGAYGTRPSQHARGARVKHLKEYNLLPVIFI